MKTKVERLLLDREQKVHYLKYQTTYGNVVEAPHHNPRGRRVTSVPSVTRLMCSQLAGNFWSTPVLVHKGLIHGVMTSLPWQTGLQSWQSYTIVLAHSVGYKWRSYQDSPSEGLISYMWIQSDSDLTGSINFQGVCVTRLMCSPLAGNFWSTPVLVHKGLIHGVMTSLPWQTGLQSWQSCTIALAHSVGYKWRFHQDLGGTSTC